jgi:predicted outer membrane repeat protein
MTRSSASSRGLAVAALLIGVSCAHAAGGVVGTGTPASCTEAAFDTVFFNAQTTAGGTISFNCGPAPHGLVFNTYKQVSANTTIDGGGLVSLSGGNAVPLFQVFASATLTLANITVTRGFGPAGAIENFGELHATNASFVANTTTQSGGAILNHGAVTLDNVTVSDNTAAKFGGGIASDAGILTITGSRFIDNVGALGGGGISLDSGTAQVTTSTFRRNRTTDSFSEGGAIRSAGSLTVAASTLRENFASRGGGLFVAAGVSTVAQTTFRGNDGVYGGAVRHADGSLILTDVTFAFNGYTVSGSGVSTTGGGAVSQAGGVATWTNVTLNNNAASFGGALGFDAGTATLTNVTFTGNRAVTGGAIDMSAGSLTLASVSVLGNQAPFGAAQPFFVGGVANRGGTLAVRNVVLTNLKGPNCYAAVPGPVFSNSSDNTCAFGIGRDNQTLRFEPLADNGGLTFTRRPVSNNPVIDNGTGVGCPAFDQRGVARPVGLACDVGAVEHVPGQPSERWDVFWRRDDGANATWQFSGTGANLPATTFAPGVETTWNAIANADVNGDGVDDVIWRESGTGQIAIWLMASPGAVGGVTFPANVGNGTGWTLAAAADVDGDGYADLAWRNTISGQLVIWYMSSVGTIANARDYGIVPLSWELRAAGDIHGDGRADLLWFQPSDGQVSIWWMAGDGSFSARFPGAVGPGGWRPYRMGDFDGDGAADILWRNEATGETAVWYLFSSLNIVADFLVSVPLAEWKLGPARDVDFDGRTDLIWYGPASGNVVRWRMQGRGILPIAESLPSVGTGWNVLQ